MFLKFKVMSSLSKTKIINLNVSWSSFLLEKKKKEFSVYLQQKNKNNKNSFDKMICVKKIQSFGFKKKNFFFFFTKIKFECSSKHSNVYFVKKKEEEEYLKLTSTNESVLFIPESCFKLLIFHLRLLSIWIKKKREVRI